MTREETMEVLATLYAAYPAFCRGMGEAELARVKDIWADALAGSHPDVIQDGVRMYIRHNRFAPTVAEVLEASQIALHTQGDLLQQYFGLA